MENERRRKQKEYMECMLGVRKQVMACAAFVGWRTCISNASNEWANDHLDSKTAIWFSISKVDGGGGEGGEDGEGGEGAAVLLWELLEGGHHLSLLHHVQLVVSCHPVPELARIIQTHFPERLQQVAFLPKETATGKAIVFCKHID